MFLPIDLGQARHTGNVLAGAMPPAPAWFTAIQSAVENFTYVPHRSNSSANQRSQLVQRLNRHRPERTLAAIESFDEPIILLLGGRDKNLPWEKLADVIRRKVFRVILFGEAADLISNAIGPKKRGQYLQSVVRCATLQEAVKTAANQVAEGNIVLLSPGGTSYDAFKDFEERGECYRKWVNELM